MNKLKQSIHENGGFQHWFVNVFWFHYRWPLLIAVAIVGIVGFITVDSLRKERYDTTVVIATDYYVDDSQLDALDALLTPVIEDFDGNGQVNIRYVTLFVGDTELGRQNQERMYLYMTEEDVACYLMSRSISDAYTTPQLDYFVDEVEQYDLPADPENAVRVSLSDNPVLKECGMEDMYFSIMDHTTNTGVTSARYARDTAISMVKALLEAEDQD